jgi:hypothetical protein
MRGGGGGGALILGLVCLLGCGSERSVIRQNSDSGGEGGGGGASAGKDAGAGRDATSAGAPSSGGAGGEPGAGGQSGEISGKGGEAGTEDAAGGMSGGGEGAVSGGGGDQSAPVFGGLVVDTLPQDQNFDLFDTPGHHVWLEISEEQVLQMNQRGGGWLPGGRDDIYQPGPSGSYADHFVVWERESDTVADYGKLEVRLVGESTFRELSKTSIPNFRVDADEFQEGMRVGTFEHFRFNNGQIGTIFREWVVHTAYRRLGYPALRSSHAFVGNTVWGEGVWVPTILMEVYKRRFCEDNHELLGGDCVNMWEFPGDVGHPVGDADICQLSTCDNGRLNELADAIATAPQGEGFKAATADFIDWPLYHQFQCLSWMFETTDDPIHAGNNNVIVERPDGKLVWLPYSVDISTGLFGGGGTPLYGSTTIPTRCQEDAQCWADTIDACSDLVDKFVELDPAKIVDEVKSTLHELGMLRPGDNERGAELRKWFVDRRAGLAEELEHYRTPPGPDGCPDDLVLCPDNTCRTLEGCDATCGGEELKYCEVLENCYDPRWQECPTCEDPAPFYCRHYDSCMSSEDECAALCPVEYPYCYASQECTSYCWMDDPGMPAD